MSIVVTGIIVVLAVLFIIGWLANTTVYSNGNSNHETYYCD